MLQLSSTFQPTKQVAERVLVLCDSIYDFFKNLYLPSCHLTFVWVAAVRYAVLNVQQAAAVTARMRRSWGT